MENHTIRLACDYFKSSQYPRWLDRTLRVHVYNPVQGTSERIAEDDIVETFTIPVYSLTLTKESEYFERLFGSGFREAFAHVVDIYITAKEKEAFQQILLLCTDVNAISLTDAEELLTLWNLSDKFMFKRSCLYSIKHLKNISLTWQQCIRIIEFSSASSNKLCQAEDLIHKCTRILIDHFQALHFLNSHIEEDQILLNELKALPSSALEALLSSDHLPVQKEEVAFYAMVIWAKHNAITKEEEQQLMTKMGVHIRFPFMKPEVLSTLTELCEMSNPFCQQLLVEGLKYKAASDEMKEKFKSEAVGHSRFRWRIGYHKPIKVITLEHPRKQATVHMSVLFEEIDAMNTDGFLEFESFNLSGNRFCFRIIQTLTSCVSKKRIGLEMVLNNNSFPRIQGDIRVSLWSQVQAEFVNKFRAWHTFDAQNPVLSCPDLLGRDWKDYTHAMDVGRKIYICVEFLDVKHVPTLRRNLISVGKLGSDGYTMIFTADSWKVTKGALVVERGAVSIAMYLINKGPSSSLDGGIPEEAWYGNKVEYSFLRVFGCEVFVHINKDDRTKLEAKSEKIIFIGYGDDDFGFKCWSIKDKKIIRSRDVDLVVDRQILGMRIARDRKERKVTLSQEEYIKKVLDRFNMQDAKPVGTSLAGHFKLSKEQCPKTEQERNQISKIKKDPHEPMREFLAKFNKLVNKIPLDTRPIDQIHKCFLLNAQLSEVSYALRRGNLETLDVDQRLAINVEYYLIMSGKLKRESFKSKSYSSTPSPGGNADQNRLPSSQTRLSIEVPPLKVPVNATCEVLEPDDEEENGIYDEQEEEVDE
ncbi:hypothetical protein KI387_044137 [Taxus chinensis]|uniref:BACK domain-containing protein n=1 Tax=Taxus chinensis TaxID=29808 RepID=A0AA38F679_TAXCH|nr:hypothetical protein KI387_044137 [Taxus chinensis]